MAELAAAAGNGGVEHDALPAAGPARDHAGELVTEDERPVEHRVADAALEKPVTIGAAQPDAADAHEHLSPRGSGSGSSCESKLARRVQPQRLQAG